MRNAEKGSGTRPRWRKWLRRILVGFLGLILILLIAGFGLRLYYSDSRLREMAERFAGERYRGEVRIGDLDLWLFSSVRVKDVSVKDESGELFSLGSARVRYDWLSLLRNRPVIEEIRLVKARIRVPPGPEERPARPEIPIRLPEIFPGKRPPVTAPAPEGTPFTVKRFVLEDGGLVFPTGDDETGIRIQGVAADWRFSGTAPDVFHATGTVSAPGGEWSRGDAQPVEIPPLNGEFSLAFDARRRGATVEVHRLSIGGLRARGSMALREPAIGPAVTDVSLDLSGGLGSLSGGLIPIEEEGLSGELSLNVMLAGPPDRLAGWIDVRLQDGRIEAGDTSIRAGLIHLEDRITVRDLDRVEARGEIEIDRILLPGLSEIASISASHLISAVIRAATFSVQEATLATSGGVARISGALTREGTGPGSLEFVLKGEGRLEKMLQPFFPVSPRQVFGEVDFEATVSGSPGSPMVTADAVSDLVQYSDSAVPDRRVFLRHVSIQAVAGPVGDATIPVSLAARMNPTVAEAGREGVDVGGVDVTGEAVFNAGEGLIGFGELRITAPGLIVSSTAELRLIPREEAKAPGVRLLWTGPPLRDLLPEDIPLDGETEKPAFPPGRR